MVVQGSASTTYATGCGSFGRLSYFVQRVPFSYGLTTATLPGATSKV